MKLVYTLMFVLFVSLIGFAQEDTTRVEPLSVPVSEVTSAKTEQAPQQKTSKFDKSKLYFGGYANMSFGSYTVIGAQPLVGYKLTPKFSIGATFSYEFINDKRYATDYSTSNYGASVFSRLRVTQNLYGHVEFSSMSYDLYNIDNGQYNRQWVPFLYVGGGYSKRIAKNTWLNAQILFDVINNENSPYKDWEPYYSIGIGVGF